MHSCMALVGGSRLGGTFTLQKLENTAKQEALPESTMCMSQRPHPCSRQFLDSPISYSPDLLSELAAERTPMCALSADNLKAFCNAGRKPVGRMFSVPGGRPEASWSPEASVT